MTSNRPESTETLEQQLRHRFENVETLTHIQLLRDINYLKEKFSCHDQAQVINEVNAEEAHIITGFGPTSAPTGGTLSVILKSHALKRETGIETTIVISNLGAWCSRQIPPEMVRVYTERFLDFIEALGIAKRGPNLRTHEDLNCLRIAGLLTRFLSGEDFSENEEATAELYGRLGLLGNMFGVWTDASYTVADILEPLFFRHKQRVLVLAGIEESYFTILARIALGRIEENYAGEFVSPSVRVGALYGKLIGGLPPYPKMSKSIRASAINLDDTEVELADKIIRAPAENDDVLLQMMNLASDWSVEELMQARQYFEERLLNRRQWTECCARYFEYFRSLKRVWEGLPRGSSRSVSIFNQGRQHH